MEKTPVGFTPVDSYYELLGFRFASGLTERFFPFFAVFLIGCSLVYLLLKEDRSLKDLVVYLLYLSFAFFLVAPMESQIDLPDYGQTPQDFQRHFENFGRDAATVRAPRAMLFMHYLIDAMVRGALTESKINIRNAYAPERLNALLGSARIGDSDLEKRYHVFLASCYLPAVSRSIGRSLATGAGAGLPAGLASFLGPSEGAPPTGGSGPDRPPLNPFLYPSEYYRELGAASDDGDLLVRNGKEVSCDEELQSLRTSIFREAQANTDTLSAMATLQNEYALKGRSNWKITLDHQQFLFNVIVTNETRAFFSAAEGEIRDLERAVPEYNIFSSSQQALSGPSHGAIKGFWRWTKSVVSFALRARQSINQWFSHHAEVPAQYYKISNTAPYVYGLAMMVILGMFPFAAALVVLPWGWKALVKWAKFLLMVKLWVLIWGMLADFNQARYQWSNSDAERGLAEDATYLFGGICVMYVLTPVIAGVAVQLLDHSVTGVAGAAFQFMPRGGAISPYFHQAGDRILSSFHPGDILRNAGNYITGGVFSRPTGVSPGGGSGSGGAQGSAAEGGGGAAGGASPAGVVPG